MTKLIEKEWYYILFFTDKINRRIYYGYYKEQYKVQRNRG